MQLVHDKRPIMSVFRAMVFTLVVLVIPAIASIVVSEAQWIGSDFVIAGALLFIISLVIDLILHRVGSSRGRLIGLAVVVLVFIYLWAELAVGIFTNLGS